MSENEEYLYRKEGFEDFKSDFHHDLKKEFLRLKDIPNMTDADDEDFDKYCKEQYKEFRVDQVYG